MREAQISHIIIYNYMPPVFAFFIWAYASEDSKKKTIHDKISGQQILIVKEKLYIFLNTFFHDSKNSYKYIGVDIFLLSLMGRWVVGWWDTSYRYRKVETSQNGFILAQFYTLKNICNESERNRARRSQINTLTKFNIYFEQSIIESFTCSIPC